MRRLLDILRAVFCRHDLYFVRVLINLAEVRCTRCGLHLLHMRDEGLLPWNRECDEFFDKWGEAA